ncbi:MAG: outer membrane protein transport protein, partial [Muribaculaceae bacterium]|nr:outer membrane protein transport protein [Muribaculaceae bacterium]
SNTVFWGMNFDIINFNYNLDAIYGENLSNAYVYNPKSNLVEPTDSQWRMRNLYSANGQGFNYQLGVIVKPIQELRFGLAFHTPTYYTLTENYSASTVEQYYGQNLSAETNGGYPGSQSYNFSSPWKVIASVAGVFGSKLILSADYEWNAYKTMKFSEPTDYSYGGNSWDWDYGWDFGVTPRAFNNDPYYATNQDIKEVYRNSSSFRIGAEYRISPNFSVRAGYSFVSSPVEAKAKNNEMTIYTAGTMPNYRFDNSTNYATAGLGYRNKGFYIDLAYVYKHMESVYHAFTPDPDDMMSYPSPQAKLGFYNSRIVLSAVFKF